MKIVLPGCRALSWNKIYSSPHWATRAEYADAAHMEVLSALNATGMHPMNGKHFIEGKVDIILTGYFDKRIIDADNLCSKIYIDALKGILLYDDNPDYVSSVTTRCVKVKKNPRLEIEIIPLDNPREK